MKEYIKKEIAFERTLFFSDAVVAIAITLLALELKITVPDGQSLSFKDLVTPWHQYLAFLLSFVNIAGFWRTHHDFFLYIKRLDERMLFLNLCWLFFIVTLPFCTSVLSSHFGTVPAIFLYSLNIFLLAILQNTIWDYADARDEYMHREQLSTEERTRMRWMMNLDMLNGLVAIIVSFFMPRLAFYLLFFKLPLFVFGFFFIARRRKEEMDKLRGRKN